MAINATQSRNVRTTNPTTDRVAEETDTLARKISTDTSSVDQTANGSAIKYKGENVAQTKGLTPNQKAALSRMGRAAKKTLDAFTSNLPDTETSDAVKFSRFMANGMRNIVNK